MDTTVRQAYQVNQANTVEPTREVKTVHGTQPPRRPTTNLLDGVIIIVSSICCGQRRQLTARPTAGVGDSLGFGLLICHDQFGETESRQIQMHVYNSSMCLICSDLARAFGCYRQT